MAKFGELRLVWLEAFVRVAESGKRTAAAAEMEITQGAVTKHIQKLEQWLGGRMLLRHNSVPASLYPDGETFLPVARQILGLLEEARLPRVPVDAPPVRRVCGKDLRVPSPDRIPEGG